MGGGIYWLPRDFMKLGQVMLKRGNLERTKSRQRGMGEPGNCTSGKTPQLAVRISLVEHHLSLPREDSACLFCRGQRRPTGNGHPRSGPRGRVLRRQLLRPPCSIKSRRNLCPSTFCPRSMLKNSFDKIGQTSRINLNTRSSEKHSALAPVTSEPKNYAKPESRVVEVSPDSSREMSLRQEWSGSRIVGTHPSQDLGRVFPSSGGDASAGLKADAGSENSVHKTYNALDLLENPCDTFVFLSSKRNGAFRHIFDCVHHRGVCAELTGPTAGTAATAHRCAG